MYGIIVFIKDVWHNIKRKVNKNNFKIVFLFKNAEDDVEYIIRDFMNSVYSKSVSKDNLYMVDINSNDHTKIILEKLMEDYKLNDIIDFDSREEIFN